MHPRRLRRSLVVMLGVWGLALGATSPLWACYAVVVGRLASTDGAVLVGHNEENGGQRVLHFYKIPRQPHPAGAMLRLDMGGQLEQTPETAAFLWSANPGLSYSDGYLNEWGVAVVSDGCRTREDDYETLVKRGEIRAGGIGYMLRRIVALRAKTAREGMELIGQLVERFGYADSGRTYVVADPKEAWLVAVVRGRRWVAQRVPDDKVVILPNVHIIGQVDLNDKEDFRASPDLVSYAVQRGWFDPKAGKPFSFREVYQDAKRLAPDPRQFRGQELATGRTGVWPPAEPLPWAVAPHKKLAVPDIVAILRNREGITPLFGRSTQESAVFQLRGGMPAGVGCVYWRTACRPDISMLTPWYVGITATPAAYAPPVELDRLLSLEHHFQPPPGTFDSDLRMAWWKFRQLAALVDADYDGRIAAVRTACASVEAQTLGRQAEIEAEALRLWQQNADSGRAYLTRYCAKLAAEACAEADRLSTTLQSR